MSMQTLTDFDSAPFEIIDGDRGKNYPKQHEFSDSGYCMFLSATNVTCNGFDFSQCQFITEQKDNVLRKGRLERDDVVLTTRGTIGNTAFFNSLVSHDQMRINSGMVILRCNKQEILPAYLYHFLRSPQFDGQVNSLRSGVAQPQLPIRDMRRIKMPLPKLSVQRRIASILSAYDDLIENNRRRIRLLEESARLLYREWFVRFRFPGYEHVKIIDGVPEGWEKVPISSFCTVGRGGSPRPIKDYMDGSVPWFKIGDATASESPFVFSTKELLIEDGVKKSVLLPLQELVLSNSATCGIPYFTGVSGCIHDGWLYFKELRRVSKYFLYCSLFAKQQEILMGIGEGATQKNLNTDYVGRQLVLLPKEQGLLANFTEAVELLFDQIFTLAQVNISLSKARDLLLPRLMNGEIEV